MWHKTRYGIIQPVSAEEEIQASTAETIRTWRNFRKMSQATLAKKLGTHQSSIAKIERNERHPDFATVARIAQVLEIPWDELRATPKSQLESTIETVAALINQLDVWRMLSRDEIEALGEMFRHIGGFNETFKHFDVPGIDSDKLQPLLDEAANAVMDIARRFGGRIGDTDDEAQWVDERTEPIRKLQQYLVEVNRESSTG